MLRLLFGEAVGSGFAWSEKSRKLSGLSLAACFPEFSPAAVRLPERFRGGCAFGLPPACRWDVFPQSRNMKVSGVRSQPHADQTQDFLAPESSDPDRDVVALNVWDLHVLGRP